MSGILYGIGTGPGEPELMTIKAVKTIERCDVVAVPVSNMKLLKTPLLLQPQQENRQELLGGCTAYQIAVVNVPEIDEKDILFMPMPMKKEKDMLKRIHDLCAQEIISLLEKGSTVGFLTLGDPTIYSTYLYLHRRIKEKGLEAQIINGIPSFCAAAARLNEGLVENKEELHIIPASYGVKEALELSGTKVLMKSGKKLGEVKEEVNKSGQKMQMVEDCGMETEKVYTATEQVPEKGSYYSLIIVKEDK